MIYDCFTFFNELEVLEIRLRELDQVADRFVLVEATQTHSGAPKRLIYQDNRRRFSRWAKRIVSVVVEDMPESDDPWVLENYQRSAIGRGLEHCGPSDVVLVSDADEIPAARRVMECAAAPGVRVFEQKLAYYFLNNISDTPWYGTRMASYETFRDMGGAQAMRGSTGVVVADGGWHFSFMGGARQIRTKLQAYAHQEFNAPGIIDPEHMSRSVQMGSDLFGRQIEYRPTDVNELPEYVREHTERFYDWMYVSPLFHEQWYDDDQCRLLAELYQQVRGATGDVVEIGCWEGRSTAALANACFPEPLIAVDTWEGNLDESPEHVSVQILRHRDVFRDFTRNMRAMTAGNVEPVVAHSSEFFRRHSGPIKFCHIDGSHDYASVRRDIEGALAGLTDGGIVCGDDFAPYAPGVLRAVRELLPGHERAGKLWFWQRR